MDILKRYRVDNTQSLHPNLMNIVDLYFTLYGIYIVVPMRWPSTIYNKGVEGFEAIMWTKKNYVEEDLLDHIYWNVLIDSEYVNLTEYMDGKNILLIFKLKWISKSVINLLCRIEGKNARLGQINWMKFQYKTVYFLFAFNFKLLNMLRNDLQTKVKRFIK